MRFNNSFEIEFPPNQVTLITGENGSGKTSVLDAICICLYGKTFRTSGRTTSGYLSINDLVNHDSDAATIRVEFENHGHNYVVTREITIQGSDGELFEDGERKALSQRVYDYVRGRAIGLDWEGFRKSTIILQGEMSSLTELDPSRRKDAFIKLFGLSKYIEYEALAQTRAKSKRLTGEKLGEANNILSLDVQKTPKATQELDQLNKSVATLEAEKQKLASLVEKREKEKDVLEADYNRFVALNVKLKGLSEQVKEAESAITEGRLELDQLRELRKQFPVLKGRYEEFLVNETQINDLQSVKAKYDRYAQKISQQKTVLNHTKKQLSDMLMQIKKVRRVTSVLKRQIPSPEELSSARKLLDESQEKKSILERQEAEVKTEIKQLNLSIKDLKAKMGQVKGKKRCPVCLQRISRPSMVINHYSGEITRSLSKIKSKKRKIRSIQAEAQTAEKELGRVKKMKEKLEKKSAKKGELDRENNTLSTVVGRRESLAAEIASLDASVQKLLGEQGKLSFDAAEYNRFEKKITILRKQKIAEAFTNAKTRLERLPRASKELQAWRGRMRNLKSEMGNFGAQVRKLRRIETRYAEAKASLEQTQDSLNEISNSLTEALSSKKHLRALLKELQEKEKTLKRNEEKIQTLKEETLILEQLRDIFKNVPENILRRLRPLVEKEGTEILNELSNAEITALNIEKETLNAAATISGTIRPIHYFSGGQKTRINMALRVAIARILSKLPQTEEHAFAAMQTLFIDEGDFGNLDEVGIREAVSFIQNLTKEFDRVILVSHVDTIKEIFQGYTIEVIKTGPNESTIKTSGGRSLQIEEPEILA